MNSKKCKIIYVVLVVMSLFLVVSGCGKSGNDSTATGNVSVNVTDAPSMDYAHVYVTVKSIAFHSSETAGINNSGWQALTLVTPLTVDLAQLANGKMYTDSSGNPLFHGFKLPVGSYRQVRIFLASSEEAYTGSEAGLTYNNEVLLPGDATHYVLRIPTPHEGIRLIPESPVVVTAGGSVNLALDFNLNNDVVEVSPNGTKEFILKPRLGYFDMNRVGAVTGTIAFGNLSTSRLVIKAEQVKDGVDHRIVRRWTSVDKTTGRFNLYPLPVFGNTSTATYDILLRGVGVQTAIVKGVKVHKGSTLTSGVIDMGTITMQPGTGFTAQLGTAMHPSGAGVHFYQTIAGDSIPYEVRYRHLNPYTGKFAKPIDLSNDPIQVATFDNVAGTIGTFVADSTSQGSFSAVADALLYSRGVAAAVTNGASPVIFNPGVPTAQPNVNSINAAITIPPILSGLNKGHLFITHGGMIVDSYQVDSLMLSNGGQFTAGNLPGGAQLSPLPGAYYGMTVLGWGPGRFGWGIERHIDLTVGNATTGITMR